jgi:phenylacetate-CoA ligase
LIRYDIGDYAEVGPQCGCGRGLPTLKRILGRERNLVRLPDGSRFWQVVGYHHYEKVAPVRQYQLVQTAIDEMEFKVVTDEPITRSQEEGFVEIIQRSMNYPFKIKVTQSHDRLPAGAGGKFEDFVCRIV